MLTLSTRVTFFSPQEVSIFYFDFAGNRQSEYSINHLFQLFSEAYFHTRAKPGLLMSANQHAERDKISHDQLAVFGTCNFRSLLSSSKSNSNVSKNKRRKRRKSESSSSSSSSDSDNEQHQQIQTKDQEEEEGEIPSTQSGRNSPH
jgi:hypothetical protein